MCKEASPLGREILDNYLDGYRYKMTTNFITMIEGINQLQSSENLIHKWKPT